MRMEIDGPMVSRPSPPAMDRPGMAEGGEVAVLRRQVARLEMLVEEQAEEIARLSARDGLDLQIWLALRPYRVSRQHAIVLAMLWTRPQILTRAAMLTALYRLRDDAPGEKILDVLICQIRRRLQGSGIEIETLWGTGWLLTADGRAALGAIIEGAP